MQTVYMLAEPIQRLEVLCTQLGITEDDCWYEPYDQQSSELPFAVPSHITQAEFDAAVAAANAFDLAEAQAEAVAQLDAATQDYITRTHGHTELKQLSLQRELQDARTRLVDPDTPQEELLALQAVADQCQAALDWIRAVVAYRNQVRTAIDSATDQAQLDAILGELNLAQQDATAPQVSLRDIIV